MTSEVVVMNSLAVALAADSAATVAVGGDNKIYNSAEKLFMLSSRHPVGVLIYNDAALLGVPWETILKMFRRDLGAAEYPRLEDYGNRLIRYLDENTHLFPASAQKRHYLLLVESLYLDLWNEIRSAVLSEYFELEDDQANAELGKDFAEKTILKKRDEWREKQNIGCFDGEIGEKIATQVSGELSQLVVKVFDGMKFGATVANALRELAVLVVSKNDFLSDAYSGVVIAGFGRDEYFPVMQKFQLGGVFCDRLKYLEVGVEKVSAEVPSIVRPFAQSEMVETFLNGVNPRFETRVIKEMLTLVAGIASGVVDGISELAEESKAEWKKKMVTFSLEAAQEVVDKLRNYRAEEHLAPIRHSITNSPKDELAHVAASLVNLNVFQKRMSLKAETVGGPIDVAVISKGDGFIWVNRKHYFRPELNPHYFRNSKAPNSNPGAQNGEEIDTTSKEERN
jgi:hypothetical protein